MEKRLVLFLVLSAVILVGHFLVQKALGPPRPLAQQAEQGKPEDQGKPAADQAAKGDQAGEDGQQAADAPEAGKKAPDETAEAPDTTQDGQPAVEKAEAQPAEPAEPAIPQSWLTLGSYAADSPYKLVVYLTNRGAAIERAELVERRANGRLRFRDLSGTHGYLGVLCRNSEEGCRVTAVGPGTPAALARAEGAAKPGLLQDDVIESIDGVTIANRVDFNAWLESTERGQTVQIAVRRETDGVAQRLVFSATLDDRPLALIDLESPISSYLLGLNRLGQNTLAPGSDELADLPSLRRAHWRVMRVTPTEVTFSYRLRSGSGQTASDLEFIKRYTLGAGTADAAGQDAGRHTGYEVSMHVEVVNHGAASQVLSYALDGPTGLPTEGWWYSSKMHPTAWGSAGARDVIWRVKGNRHSLRSATQIYKQAQEDTVDTLTSVLTDNPTPEERTLDYLGVDIQYFAAVLMGGTSDAPESLLCQQAYAMPVGTMQQLDSRHIRTLNTTFRLVMPDETIEAGASSAQNYHLYLGPKAPALLEKYNLTDTVVYGWFWWIARPLSKVLHFFYAIVHNYGLAIILLTVLVRGAMFPIGRKAALNAQKMQELAPEIKKIKEKYKNDLEKQGQAQRELWKKHNFNPLGSCWLMFLQLPIFIGLYRCLSVDIELRQAPLIPGIDWCSNLAGPDMAWRWENLLPGFLASETGWLGPYLNILPIFTIVLFIWQQKMFTPPATDEQTRMQQKMMQYMMIFMGVLFFKVPAGLCIYFIASSLWGIGERKLLPPPSAVPASTTATPPASDGEPKKQSLLDRLMQKERPESVEEVRARRKSRR